MVRRAHLVACLGLLIALLALPAVASAQDPGPFDAPRLSDEPPGGGDGQPTATATPAPTATATATTAPTATATASDLPATGADPLRLLLAGLTLLGFGLALRFRVALADARHPL